MLDYPYVYAQGPVRPVGPGGVRLRILRKHPRVAREGSTQERQEVGQDSAWRKLLEEAVVELNTSLMRAGTRFTCALEEEEAGFSLRVTRVDPEGPGAETTVEEADEALAITELPQWLARLRSRLGILVDEKA